MRRMSLPSVSRLADPSADMRITFVKKILANGEPCAKCADVEQRLQASGQMARIDRVVVADERDPNSAGMRLATRHQVAVAPFFVVEDGDETTVYPVYLRFVKEVLGRPVESVDESVELLRANPDLDLV